jgi:hypothetical protein
MPKKKGKGKGKGAAKTTAHRTPSKHQPSQWQAQESMRAPFLTVKA